MPVQCPPVRLSVCTSASGYWDRCCPRGRNYPTQPIYPLCSAPSAHPRTPGFLLASHFGANLSGTAPVSHGSIQALSLTVICVPLSYYVDFWSTGRTVCLQGLSSRAAGGQLVPLDAVLSLLSSLTTPSNWPPCSPGRHHEASIYIIAVQTPR